MKMTLAKRYSRTKTYTVWWSMRRRCENPKQKSYERYGGRGITVCERWQSYENFLEDMGHVPQGKSLDRIDNNGPYSPENCRWATLQEQGRNKRNNRLFTMNGKTQCLAAWSSETGISESLVLFRLGLGWSVENALTRKPDRARRGEQHRGAKLKEQDVIRIYRLWMNGERSQSDLAREYGVSRGAITAIIRNDTWRHIPREP